MKMEGERVFATATFLPFARRLSQNKYLSAVRHSFFAILPFLLAVSLLDVLFNLILNPIGPVMSENGLNLGYAITGRTGDAYFSHHLIIILTECTRMMRVGYGLLSIIFAMSLSRRLAEIWGADTLMTSLCALAAFMFLIPLAAESGEALEYVSGRRFLPAFLVTVISSRIYASVSRLKISLYEPLPHLPKNLAKFFNAAVPVSITLLILAIISLVAGSAAENFADLITRTVPDSFWQHPIVALLYQGIISILWWFGFPGYGFMTNIEEIAYIPAQMSNQAGETSYIFTSGFFDAVSLHVMGLIIAICVFSNHENWRRVALISVPCVVFNIQDPIMFCLPVILNPVFFIPYLTAPIANTALGYIAVLWGITPTFSETLPWTMPLICNGIMGTHSFMGGALEIAWLVMDIFIYAPFVITANMLDLGDEKK